jgi:hypothetical protein
MQIRVAELREICEKLLRFMEDQELDILELPVDYYWNIPKKQVYDPYIRPTEIDLGQLADDWNELRKMAKSDEEPLMYHLVWLAAILRSIGDHTYI